MDVKFPVCLQMMRTQSAVSLLSSLRHLMDCCYVAGARASVYCATSTEAVHKGHLSEGYISSSLEPESPDPVACDPRMSAHIWRFSASETHLPPELDILDIDKAMAGLSKENVQKSCKL
jgi:hypothetical protein